jgi:putative effector of murein hydrolase LrgA (UPF0299 family)
VQSLLQPCSSAGDAALLGPFHSANLPKDLFSGLNLLRREMGIRVPGAMLTPVVLYVSGTFWCLPGAHPRRFFEMVLNQCFFLAPSQVTPMPSTGMPDMRMALVAASITASTTLLLAACSHCLVADTPAHVATSPQKSLISCSAATKVATRTQILCHAPC